MALHWNREHDTVALYCPLCGECTDCDLRPCTRKGAHVRLFSALPRRYTMRQRIADFFEWLNWG